MACLLDKIHVRNLAYGMSHSSSPMSPRLLRSLLLQPHVGQASTLPILDSAILGALSGIVAWYKRPVLAGSLKDR